MATVLRIGSLRFVIWPNDHTPAHVHVFSAEGSARIGLAEVELQRIDGMSRKDAAKALEATFGHRQLLLAAWERIHGTAR